MPKFSIVFLLIMPKFSITMLCKMPKFSINTSFEMPKFSVYLFSSCAHYFLGLFLCLIPDRECYPSYEYKV